MYLKMAKFLPGKHIVPELDIDLFMMLDVKTI